MPGADRESIVGSRGDELTDCLHPEAQAASQLIVPAQVRVEEAHTTLGLPETDPGKWREPGGRVGRLHDHPQPPTDEVVITAAFLRLLGAPPSWHPVHRPAHFEVQTTIDRDGQRGPEHGMPVTAVPHAPAVTLAKEVGSRGSWAWVGAAVASGRKAAAVANQPSLVAYVSLGCIAASESMVPEMGREGGDIRVSRGHGGSP